MFYYAQLNEGNLCVGVSALSGEIEAENMIEIESYDVTLCGKKYNDGKWEEVPVEPTEPEPTEIQILAQQVADLELAILGGAVNV